MGVGENCPTTTAPKSGTYDLRRPKIYGKTQHDASPGTDLTGTNLALVSAIELPELIALSVMSTTAYLYRSNGTGEATQVR